jgi:hypothetical protein
MAIRSDLSKLRQSCSAKGRRVRQEMRKDAQLPQAEGISVYLPSVTAKVWVWREEGKECRVSRFQLHQPTYSTQARQSAGLNRLHPNPRFTRSEARCMHSLVVG